MLHYRGDRVIPHRGGLQLAEGLPDARLVTLEGRYHLPDIRDLNHIDGTITAFLSCRSRKRLRRNASTATGLG